MSNVELRRVLEMGDFSWPRMLLIMEPLCIMNAMIILNWMVMREDCAWKMGLGALRLQFVKVNLKFLAEKFWNIVLFKLIFFRNSM